jgi:Tfp pilus assembly protein PilZ
MIDLSVTGAYVQTETLPLEGEAVVLKFRVPGNDRLIEVPCVVAWVNPQQKHLVHSLPPGSGLHFRDVAQEDNILIVGTIRAYCQSNPIYRQYL